MPSITDANNRDLNSSMGLFEAAARARPVTLQQPTLDAVVVALDGSNQDDTARLIGRHLAAAQNARVHEQGGAADAAEILRVCREQSAKLLVVPVPFRRDITVLRDESLSSVVDMLLRESACPVLCVRQPMDEAAVRAAFADVLVAVLDHEGDHAEAASWALRLVSPAGRLELLGVADRDVLEEARRILGDTIDPKLLRAEALDRAVTADIGGLVAAVQKHGFEAGLDVVVETRVGRPIPVVIQAANDRSRLAVIDRSRDHTSIAYHHATNLILGADGPVLVV